MYKKTRELLIFIIQNWNYLPYDLRTEFADVLTYYKDLVIYSKFEKNFKS